VLFRSGSFMIVVDRGDDNTFLKQFEAFSKIANRKDGVLLAFQEGSWDGLWAEGVNVYEVSPNILEPLPEGVMCTHTLQQTTFTVTLSSAIFESIATSMKNSINSYLWNEDKGMFYDYNCKKKIITGFDSVTCLYALWAGVASKEQAARMVPLALSLFCENGGLASGTKASRGEIHLKTRPQRQWDYPFGWAPHQMLAWKGLADYGFHVEASDIAYRWLYMVTRTFMDFNGVVPEKFDVVDCWHDAHDVEYGTVGTDFKCVTREGFGWMNASFSVGLKYLSTRGRRSLGVLNHPDAVCRNVKVATPATPGACETGGVIDGVCVIRDGFVENGMDVNRD